MITIASFACANEEKELLFIYFLLFDKSNGISSHILVTEQSTNHSNAYSIMNVTVIALKLVILFIIFNFP